MKTTRNTSSWIFRTQRWQRGKRAQFARSVIVLFIVILFGIIGGQRSFGQGVGISESSIVPNSSSILELRSSLRGFLAPRMTTAERTAIVSPAQGLLVYDATTQSFWYFETTWKTIASGTLGTSNQLLGMNAAGNANEYKTLAGTTNQINILFTPGNIVLSTPQNIHTGASPTFAGLTLTSPLTVPNGGTGLQSGVSGGIPYFSTNTTMASSLLLTANGVIIGGGAGTAPSTIALGSAGQVLQSNGVGTPSWSTPTYPSLSGAAGKILRSNGTNNVYTTSTFADTYLASNLLYSNGANNVTGLATVNGGILNAGNTGIPSITITPTIGVLNNSKGTISLTGNTSGVVTIQPQAAAGTYNFNLPVNAGTSGQALLSGGGLAAPMTFGTLGVPGGGTGLTTFGGTNTVLYTSAADVLTSVATSTAAGQFLQTTTSGGAPTWKTILDVVNGGTGQSSYVNGELLIGNTIGNTLTKTTLTGTLNQVNVTNGNGSITLSTPQDIHTGAAPTFLGLTLSGLTVNSGVYTDGSKALTSTPPTSGNLGYWNRLGTVLSPTTPGDAVTTSGNIYTTGAGTITSAGLFTGSLGATVTGAAVNLNSSSNFATNINTGTSAGNVTIGNALSSLYLPKFTTAGILHNDITGLISTSLVSLTADVSGTLPVFNGGTGLTTFGGTNTVLYTSAPDVLTSVSPSTSAGQFLQTTTSGGAPTWKTILDVANGGTGQSTYVNGEILIGNTTGNTLTKATLTGTADQVIVT
ncbi:MAG: hypothetical protein EPN88_10340, partial [Bacteroidetes bacterium]